MKSPARAVQVWVMRTKQFLLKLKLKFSEIWAQEGVSAYGQEFFTKNVFQYVETLN